MKPWMLGAVMLAIPAAFYLSAIAVGLWRTVRKAVAGEKRDRDALIACAVMLAWFGAAMWLITREDTSATLRQGNICVRECLSAGYSISHVDEPERWRDSAERDDPIRCSCRHGNDEPSAAVQLFSITGASARR